MLRQRCSKLYSSPIGIYAFARHKRVMFAVNGFLCLFLFSCSEDLPSYQDPNDVLQGAVTAHYVLSSTENVLINKKNIRWINSNGRVGGELGDPSAYYDLRRVHIGIKLEF